MPNILITLQFMFNSLDKVSVLSMLPFLILTPIDERKDMYRFLQYKGKFYSRPFSVLPLKLKAITWVTPFRYFLNKRIFAQIEKLARLEEYEAFVSFKNPITIHVSLYNKNIAQVKNFTIKLFSGSIDLSLTDVFVYWFKLNKKQRLELKLKKLQTQIEKLQYIANLPTIEDMKVINKETKTLINTISKKYKQEQKEKKKEIEKKNIDNVMADETRRQQVDLANITNTGNKTTEE